MAAELFGGEVRLGELLQFFGFVAGGIVGAIMLGRRVERVVAKVDVLETTMDRNAQDTKEKIDRQSVEISKLGEVIGMMGRYEERFTWINKAIDDLRRGRGYIVESEPSGSGAHRK